MDSEYYQMVLKTAVAQHGYEIAPEVDLAELLKALKKRRGRKFAGNQTITELADKAIALKKKSTGTILQPEDFSFISQSLTDLWQNRPQEHNSAAISAVERMNKHIYGLEQIKKQVIETVNVLKLREYREKRGLTTDGLTPHNTCLFIGPPGVGKTEIAKYFAEILFEENLLPGKKFLNLNSAELKGQYVGHTAPRITRLFEEYDAIFLDEAYSLAASHNGQMDIFSQEALAQLCVELEEHARDKLVILAGYGGDIRAEDNKMWEFLRANPGIASRITFHFNFPRYSPDREMPEIFKLMAQNAGWILEEGWRDVVVDFFTKRGKDANYGNAREGRRLLEQAIVIQAGNLDFSVELSDDELKTLNCHDLKEATARILEAENHLKNPDKPPIGFR
ncbi:MAG: AAA family ATPase [Syntrophomonadaceae bacterium]|nr:AAA family ATPase [Syntrophomonadaceae bacterium]